MVHPETVPSGRKRQGPNLWLPTWTLKERLIHSLVPGGIYWRYRVNRAWRKGKPELRFLGQFVDPERTSVDAGANRGVFTWFLSRLSRHVYAYEPNPKMHRILARCARRRNVSVSSSALSDANGSQTLFIPARASGRYSNQQATLREGLYEDVGSVQVTTRRLDDEDVGPVGFIKIDVEGHEQSVLRGAEETIREHRPVLLVEIVEWCSGRPDRESFDLVCERGYRGLFYADGMLSAIETYDPTQHPAHGRVRDFFFVPA